MPIKTSHKQGLRLFFSADLTGSTAYKNREQNLITEIGSGNIEWPAMFTQFFSQMYGRFINGCRDVFEKDSGAIGSVPELWRIAGDEILFYSSTLRNYEEAVLLIYSFVKVIQYFDNLYKKEKGLGVKGTIWAAGFPLRNKLILVDPKVSPHFWIDDLEFELDDAVWASDRISIDFIGPEIDLGFRLATLSYPGRVVLSLDTAVLIAKSRLIDEVNVRMFHVGWRRLKGIYGEVPYPVIWCDIQKLNPKPRTSYEESESDFSAKYLDKNLSYSVTKNEILELNHRHYEDTDKFRLKEPYLNPESKMGEMPGSHVKVWVNKHNKGD